VIHKVRSGETLSGIARKYGTSVSAIRKWNGLRSNSIRPGQRIKIYRA
jgi:membrane-bound lytic murein transglycosylase D